MKVEGLTIYHVKSHLQVYLPFYFHLEMSPYHDGLFKTFCLIEDLAALNDRNTELQDTDPSHQKVNIKYPRILLYVSVFAFAFLSYCLVEHTSKTVIIV